MEQETKPQKLPIWLSRLLAGFVLVALVGFTLFMNAKSQPQLSLKTIRQAVFDKENTSDEAGFGTHVLRGTVIATTDTTLGIFVEGSNEKVGTFYWVPKTHEACPGETVNVVARAYRQNWWSTGNHPWKVELFNPQKEKK